MNHVRVAVRVRPFVRAPRILGAHRLARLLSTVTWPNSRERVDGNERACHTVRTSAHRAAWEDGDGHEPPRIRDAASHGTRGERPKAGLGFMGLNPAAVFEFIGVRRIIPGHPRWIFDPGSPL